MITDVHAHVLPGLDDGPDNLNESHKLLAAFHDAGTDRVFCTSHLLSPHFEVTYDEMEQAFSILTEQHRNHAPLLALGTELRLASEFTDYLKEERIPSLGNTRYVLVEFHSNCL